MNEYAGKNDKNLFLLKVKDIRTKAVIEIKKLRMEVKLNSLRKFNREKLCYLLFHYLIIYIRFETDDHRLCYLDTMPVLQSANSYS